MSFAPIVGGGTAGLGGTAAAGGGLMAGLGAVAPWLLPVLLPSLLGSKQVAPAAPAYQPGPTPGVGNDTENLFMDTPPAPTVGDLTQGLPDWFVQGSTPKPDTTADEQNPIEAIFGNLDSNLQSPSKQLGLGLLGQINPNLPYAGLLAMGLLGPNKFGSR